MTSSLRPVSTNAIFVPSGDHEGPNADESGDTLGVVSACGLVPFAFTTQIAYGFVPTTNASLLLSGDHAISFPVEVGVASVPSVVSCVWPLPFRFISQISVDPAVV